MGFTITRVTGVVGTSTYSTVDNDLFTKEVGRENRTRMDMHGISDAVGRGETDTDITYQTLINEGGDPCFIYPNAAGNGIIVTQTRP